MILLTATFELLQAAGLDAEELANCRESHAYWQHEDCCQRPGLLAELQSQGIADPVAAGLLAPDATDEPMALLPEMTAEQLLAIADAEAARARVEDVVGRLHQRPAPRRANCGQTLTIHLRRDHPTGGVQDGLFRPRCKRSDCPHCWRHRLTRTLKRAAGCLLDAGPDDPAARLGQLHVSHTTWEQWQAYDRAMRRQVGGDCGRLRIRRADGTVLVIAERPWAGSRPVSPAEAADMASEAIQGLHTARHACRQLGAWADHKPREWRCLARFHGCIDLAAVEAQLARLGTRSHLLTPSDLLPRSQRIRTPDLNGLFWRAESEEAAQLLLAEVCPTLANRGNRSTRTPHGSKSDRRSVFILVAVGPSEGQEGPFGDDWWAEDPPPW